MKEIKVERKGNVMFKFSPYGIKNPEIWQFVYADFIEWCMRWVQSGTFSTYCDGEPVCLCAGMELSYRDYLQHIND